MTFLREYITTGFLFLITGGFQNIYYKRKNDLFLERDKIYRQYKNV